MTSVPDLEDFPEEPPRGNRRYRLLHRADYPPAGFVRFYRAAA